MYSMQSVFNHKLYGKGSSVVKDLVITNKQGGGKRGEGEMRVSFMDRSRISVN